MEGEQEKQLNTNQVQDDKKKGGNAIKEKLDPYAIQYMIYKAEMYILMKYPHLIDLNKK